MKIIVLVKQVPSTTNTKMDPETGVMNRNAADSVINPLDEHAIAEALKIKESKPGTEIIALTMGPPSARKALQEACARGADSGVLLSHKAFGGSDTIATSRVLAAAIRKTGTFDLILAGEKATDGETGQTGPMTASLLDIPVITYTSKLDVKDGSINAWRMVEDGLEEINVKLPAMVTVVKDINDPPLPTLRRHIIARKLSFPVWGPEEIGLDSNDTGLKGSPTRVVKIFSPKLSRNTTFHTTNTDVETAGAIAAVLEALKTRSMVKWGEKNGD